MCLQGSNVAVIGDRMEAAVYAAAYNDYLLEHWLGVDSRFRLAMLVAPQDAQVAVREIERTAGKRGVAGLFLPMADIPWSAASMEPILAAAQDAELPSSRTSGAPSASSELHCSVAPIRPAGRAIQPAAASRAGRARGLIWEGVFEKFPRLKFVFIEYGWTWVPSFLWRQDSTWKTARRTMPWVKRPPSDYIREQVRFTSEPALDVPNSAWENDLLAQMSAERTLCFSTDYPHWDSDDPHTVFRHISPELRRRIFRENALETFGDRILLKRPAVV